VILTITVFCYDEPVTLSTLPGTATTVAATTTTMMKMKKKKMAAVARNRNSKFPILKICPPMTVRMRMAMAVMAIAVMVRTKVVATRTATTARGRKMAIVKSTRTPPWTSEWHLGLVWNNANIKLVRTMVATMTTAIAEGRRDGLRGRKGQLIGIPMPEGVAEEDKWRCQCLQFVENTKEGLL
jgi:hypothetical protein